METEVAIVGGGPVGLSAALILGKLRVKVVLVERNASTSVHPRGHLVNARTMEIFRALGCDADVARGGGCLQNETPGWHSRHVLSRQISACCPPTV